MLLASAAVPLPLREAITFETGSTYVNGIFAVRPHTSERDTMSDVLSSLTWTLASGAAGSSQILLPRVFPLARHSNVPAEFSLLVAERNLSPLRYSFPNETFRSSTFALWVEAIRTDSTLFEAATVRFLSKEHHI